MITARTPMMTMKRSDHSIMAKNTNYFVDFHALQTVPASNLNRDDTGSPKSMTFGGVRRARVSSQAWKKAMRDYFVENYDENESGVRTLEIPSMIVDEIMRQQAEAAPTAGETDAPVEGCQPENETESTAPEGCTPIQEDQQAEGASPSNDETVEGCQPETAVKQLTREEAEELAVEALGYAGIKLAKADKKTGRRQLAALLFVSRAQVQNIAAIMLDGSLDDKERKNKVKDALRRGHAVDMALFGRMVADDPSLNVEAAAQVAHSLGVTAVTPEFDFYTAVDDHSLEDHAGSAMMGTIEYNSSTYYRYADVSLAQLMDNLGDPEAVGEAVGMFTKAFIEALPGGKQNTFAAQSLPSAVVVTVRAGRPVSYANAFVNPVRGGHNDSAQAESAMVDYAESVAGAYDLKPVASFVLYLGDSRVRELGEGCNESELVAKITGLVKSLVDVDGAHAEEA